MFPLSAEEWSDCSRDAQPSAGAEEGRGDSPQNQSHASRPAEQVEGERETLQNECVWDLLTSVYCVFTLCFSSKRGP